MNQGDRREAAGVPAGDDGGWITCSEPFSCLLLVGTELGLWDLMLSDKSPFASCAVGAGSVKEGERMTRKTTGGGRKRDKDIW